MYRLLPSFLLLPACLAAAEPAPVLEGAFAVRLEDKPAATLVTSLPGKDGFPVFSVKIDWLAQDPAPAAFRASFDPKTNTATSTHNLGAAHITRTVIATPDAVFLHFLADSPGALSFRTSLLPPGGQGAVRVENRRELAWAAAGESEAQIRVWVIPFESDVETEGDSVTLRGEGECLVVIAAATGGHGASVAGRWRSIAARHDPGVEHPDPVKIWQAISARAAAP